MILVPYFYNNASEVTEEELLEIQKKALERYEYFHEKLENYETWRKLVKDYNKFELIKHRKREYSRFAWHKECEALEGLYNKIDELDKDTIISTAYVDAFWYTNNFYYPIDFPQIFKVEGSPKILTDYENFSNYLENLEENSIFNFVDEENITLKEVKDSVSEFFSKYPKGVVFMAPLNQIENN